MTTNTIPATASKADLIAVAETAQRAYMAQAKAGQMTRSEFHAAWRALNEWLESAGVCDADWRT
jgi:hypothetical protein